MKRNKPNVIVLSCALLSAFAAQVRGELIANGGFESGLTGWVINNQVGSEGAFMQQTGTQTPVTMGAVPPPPGGAYAAMTDAAGPGSHILYQDFVVPSGISMSHLLTFSVFVNNQAPDFYTPEHLDFATPDLNQQARVDILSTTVDPFSIAPADILLNLYMTRPGDPLVSGYRRMQADVTPLLLAHAGSTLRLRFAEVDNVFTLNFGVDDVSINAVPEPATFALTGLMLLGAAACRRKRST